MHLISRAFSQTGEDPFMYVRKCLLTGKLLAVGGSTIITFGLSIS